MYIRILTLILMTALAVYAQPENDYSNDPVPSLETIEIVRSGVWQFTVNLNIPDELIFNSSVKVEFEAANDSVFSLLSWKPIDKEEQKSEKIQRIVLIIKSLRNDNSLPKVLFGSIGFGLCDKDKTFCYFHESSYIFRLRN